VKTLSMILISNQRVVQRNIKLARPDGATVPALRCDLCVTKRLGALLIHPGLDTSPSQGLRLPFYAGAGFKNLI